MLRNRPVCSFDSYLIVSLTPFANKPDSWKDLNIYMISFISSFEIINVVIPDPKIIFQKAVFVGGAAAVIEIALKYF